MKKKKGFKKAVLGRPEGLWAVQRDCVATGIFSSFFSGYFFFWGVGFGRPIRQCVATGGKRHVRAQIRTHAALIITSL